MRSNEYPEDILHYCAKNMSTFCLLSNWAKSFPKHLTENTKVGECLWISSLPGKALRMLVDIARLAEQFNMHSQSRAR